MVAGSPVTFTVVATGGGTLTHKWQQNGADLHTLLGVSGETTNILQIDNVKKNHEGTYTCILSNAAGDTTSKPAHLTVRKYLYLVFLIESFADFEDKFCASKKCGKGRGGQA